MEDIKKDILILVLCILGLDDATLSPEAREVRDRWKSIALEYFFNGGEL